jgi:hypothetical protein
MSTVIAHHHTEVGLHTKHAHGHHHTLSHHHLTRWIELQNLAEGIVELVTAIKPEGICCAISSHFGLIIRPGFVFSEPIVASSE